MKNLTLTISEISNIFFENDMVIDFRTNTILYDFKPISFEIEDLPKTKEEALEYISEIKSNKY